MEASDARESGSDSEWAIVDEAPSVQEANEDAKYMFRGDGSRVSSDRGPGEVSDGESIEIVPDDRDVEALEAIAEPQEQEQPLNLDRVEEISPPVESTSTANLSWSASESRSAAVPLARLSDRDHWDFVAILLVALVGGFTVGFFCGSTGAIPPQPSSVSEDIGRLHIEIDLLQTAFKALQAATIASEGPPLAAASNGELPVPADMGQLYADFVSFQCRWRNNCRLGNAFCFSRTAEPIFGNTEEHSMLTEAEKAWGLTEADLKEQEGWVPDCLDDDGQGSDGEEDNGDLDIGSEGEPAANDGDEFRSGLDVTPDEIFEDTFQTAEPLQLKDESVIFAGYVSAERDLKLSAESVSKIVAESDFKISTESDLKQSPESDLKHSKMEALEALRGLAALLAPSANMTMLTQALTLSVHEKTGTDGFNVEAEFASLAERRVAKLTQRLESLRQRAAEKAGRAIARAQSDLTLAKGRMCSVIGAGPLCPGNTPGPKQGPAESTVKHSKKDKKREDKKVAEQKEKAKEWAKKEFSKTGKKFDKEGGNKRASEASSKAERNNEKHVNEGKKSENGKPKGETNRNEGHPKSSENKEWKEKTAEKLPDVETKEGKSKKREKTDKALRTEDAEKYKSNEKESEKRFQKEKMNGKKFSKTWKKEDAHKNMHGDKESGKSFLKERMDDKKSKNFAKEKMDDKKAKNFDKDKKDDEKSKSFDKEKKYDKKSKSFDKDRTDDKQSAGTWGKGKRGDEGEQRKDRKVKEEARKVGKQGDKKERSEACDRSDCEDRPPHRGTKPKGDSGPRRAFDWPTPCEPLATDWPTDTEACQSVDSAKNVSWVFARGCGREASRSSQAQSDWLFDRAAARKQSRDLPKFSEWEKPKRSEKSGCADCEHPEKASSKFAKRWLPERMVAAGRKMREAFQGMKQRAMKWR